MQMHLVFSCKLEKCNYRTQCKQDEINTLVQIKHESHIGSYSDSKGVKGRSLKLNSVSSVPGGPKAFGRTKKLTSRRSHKICLQFYLLNKIQ